MRDNAQIATQAAQQSPGLEFRPDIQGLRALAIIVVVACHAGLPGFAGGFVGVDMFFVISGFLITGLLVREVGVSGRVDLPRFWSRRCKRLLPALLLVTVVTLLLARVVLAPIEQLDQTRAAFFVPLWLGNFYFTFADFDYFSPEAASNVFLHTWSLAVEEQFYLVWPFLVAGLFVRKAGQGAEQLWQGLALILAASFVLCIVTTWQAPLVAFYMMPTRAWQFATGGLVFLLLERKEATGQATLHHAEPCMWSGLLALVLAVFLLDDEVAYPGLYAALPTLGTALLLYGGAARKGAVFRLLAQAWMQGIGNVSYSWYLWHWPVLTLGAVLFVPAWGPYPLHLVLVAVSLGLAVLTWYTLENPVRHASLLARRPRFTLAVSVALMVLAGGSVKWLQAGAETNAGSEEQIVYQQVRSSLPPIYGMGCDEWFSGSRVIACSFGDQNAGKKAVLIGDSIGAQWFSALARPLVEAGWQFVVYTKSSCPILDQPFFYARIGMIFENCATWRRNLLPVVAALAPDLVFFGSAATYEFSAEEWREGTVSVLAELAPAAGQVFVIRGTPLLPFNGPGCLARRGWQPGLIAGFTDCSADVGADPGSEAHAGLQAAATAFPNVQVLDLNPLVCPGNVCTAERDGMVVFRDNQHLADQYVAALAPRIFDLLRSLSPASAPTLP